MKICLKINNVLTIVTNFCLININHFTTTFRMKNKLSTDVTSLQQKLVDLESSTTNKIRSVVLEVLSSVTHNSPDTRFFGDWLRANFLTREQFDVRFNADYRSDVR